MEISKQIQDEINSRQSGMCGHCGRLIDEIQGAQREFLTLKSADKANPTVDNSVLICNYCTPEIRKITEQPDYSMKKYSFGYAGFSNYSQETKLIDFREEVEKTLAFINNSGDLRASRNMLNETIKTLRTLGLPKEVYDDLNAQLSSKLSDLIEGQKAEYAKMEVLQKENFEKLKVKIEEVYNAVAQVAVESEAIKEVRERLIKVQNEMNSLNLNREDKDGLIAKFNEAFNILSGKQAEDREKYEMECSENYLNLKPKVESACEFAAIHPIFKEARQKLIEVQNLFKGLKLKRDNREELFNKMQTAFAELNAKQDAEREGVGQEADENYEKIKPVVEEAINIADNSTNYKEARATLVDAQGSIKLMKLRKEQREVLYDAIRGAFDRLNERQSDEREIFEKEANENNEVIVAKLSEVEKELNNEPEFNKIRDILIAIQAEIKLLNLKRDHRNQAFGKIRELFGILDEKRKAYRINRVAMKASRLNSVKGNLSSRVIRLEDSITWDYKSLNFQKEKLANLIDREDPKIIEEINAKIAMFDERIKEKEANIAELKKRLEDVDKDINQIAKNKNERDDAETAETAEATPEAVAEPEATETPATEQATPEAPAEEQGSEA